MDKLTSIGEVYNSALKRLPDKNREIDIRLIINKVNKYNDMSCFYLYRNNPILSIEEFEHYFEQYLAGMPVEYVTNEAYFDGDVFYVNEHSLIPRVETEEVVHNCVDLAKKYFKNDRKFAIYDPCTGSGCIGITLSKYLPVEELTLSDISDGALEVAKTNVVKFATRLPKATQVLKMNCIDDVKSFDRDDLNHIVISNPPYIIDEKVEESVLDYEPHSALFTDKSLSVYVGILEKVKKFNHACLVVFEISDEIEELLSRLVLEIFGEIPYTIIKDINGRSRTFGMFIDVKSN